MKDRGDKFIDAFSENILYNTGCGIDTGEKKARGLEKLLTDSIAGTMVLCFTEGGAVDLMKELADKGLSEGWIWFSAATEPSPAAIIRLFSAR